MEEFVLEIKRFLKNFKEIKKEPVKILVKNDPDGILSAAILIQMFKRDNVRFKLSFENKLSKSVLKELKLDPSNTILLVKFDKTEIEGKDVFVINNKKLDGRNCLGFEDEISCAGICYFLAKEYNINNKNLSHLGFLGCVCEKQDKEVFSKLNNILLQEGLEGRKITISKGLRLFSFQTKGLSKMMEESFKPFIPGISGNREGIIKMFKELDIEIKNNEKIKGLIDMNEIELKKLFSAVVVKVLGEIKGEIFGPLYILKTKEMNEDVRGFALLLDVFCKINKPYCGVGLVLESKAISRKAILKFDEFGKEMVDFLEWFCKNRRGNEIIEKDNIVIIHSPFNFNEIHVEFMVNLLLEFSVYGSEKIIVTISQTIEGNTKIRFFYGDKRLINDFLKSLENTISVEKGESVVIKQENEEEIVKYVKEWFDKRKVEEIVK